MADRSMLPNFEDTSVAFQYRSNKDLKQARFLFSSMASPLITKVGMKVTSWAISLGLPVKGIIRNTIFRQFCGGETLDEASRTAAMLGKYHVGAILDYGVEGKESEEEFDHAVPEFIKAIEAAAHQKNVPFISLKITGFTRFALLEKIDRLETLNAEEQAEWNRAEQRIQRICEAAARTGIMVLVDAEETWIQHPVNLLADEMMRQFNVGRMVVFNTFQCYTKNALSHLHASLKMAEEKGYLLGAKLVRGAYMEKERRRAQENGYPDPIQPNKAATDNDYDEALMFCLERLDKLAVFIGTHNEASCQKAASWMHEHGIAADHPHVWFSQLYGMSDNISFNLAGAGYNVAKYLPYGPVKDVIPYLMRRAQENTSVAGQTSRELSLINREMKRRKLL